MRERTQIEHAGWLYEQLMSDGYLHGHTTFEEFWADYSTGLVMDEFEDGGDISHIIADFQKLQSSTRGNPDTPPTKTEQANVASRKKRHEHLMKKWPPL